MSHYHAELIADIEAFLERTGMSEITLGRKAVNDPHFVKDVRGTRRVWPQTEERVRTFMQGWRSDAEPEQRTHDSTSAIDDVLPEVPGIEVHAAALDDPARVCDLCDEPVGDPGKRVCGVVDCPHRVKAAA